MQCSETYLPLTEQQCLFVLQISGGTFQTQAAACVVTVSCIYWDNQFAVISRSAGIVAVRFSRCVSAQADFQAVGGGMLLLFTWRGNYGNGVVCCRLIIVRANEHCPDSLQHSAQDRLSKELLRLGCSALIVSMLFCRNASLHKAASRRAISSISDRNLKAFRVLQPSCLSLVALCDVSTLHLSRVLWGLTMVATGQSTSFWGWMEYPFLHQAWLSYFELAYLSVQMH